MFRDAIPGAHRPRYAARPLDFIAWFLLLLLICVAASKANAHWRYPIECCHDNDCQSVPDSFVHEAGDALIIRIPPGAHKMWSKDSPGPLVAEIPRSALRKPLDGEWHVCIGPSGSILCVFPPMRGF